MLWPTLVAVPTLAVLLALGVWQVARGEWKSALIAARERAFAAAPIPFPGEAGAIALLDHVRVALSGTFRHEHEFHLIAPPKTGRNGFHVVTPLAPEGSGTWVLVDRGFVPVEAKAPSARTAGQVAGPVTVVGIARPPPSRRAFAGANDPAGNVWAYVDPEAMAAVVGRPLAPTLIVAEPIADARGWPRPEPLATDLANPHLGYALTWFGLAAALVVIYILLFRGRFR
jgi:surfeit locus 1 family protein